jgi:hypothetical protein
VANVIDFLRRARQHGVRVVPILEALPLNDTYRIPTAEAEGMNAIYLTAAGVAAKMSYATSMVSAVAAAEGGSLLSTVFGWELENEVYVQSDKLPLSRTSGTITTGDGLVYDLTIAADRQQCVDANIVHWASAVAGAIRGIDPAAMVTASVFTYNAVGQGGPAGVPANHAGDPRIPARPLMLQKYSTLDYLDIHLYPTGPGYSLDGDLASSEWPAIDNTSKPVLLGEFGAYKAYYPDLAGAIAAVKAVRAGAYARGFAGSMFWAWDTIHQPELWGADASDGAIDRALSGM